MMQLSTKYVGNDIARLSAIVQTSVIFVDNMQATVKFNISLDDNQDKVISPITVTTAMLPIKSLFDATNDTFDFNGSISDFNEKLAALSLS